ncbi:MAG: glycine cleavage system protein GcvH [Nitrospirae bacterium]|nr:glycine cleavage system protein GcvH [Nitrospirota bacterium]
MIPEGLRYHTEHEWIRQENRTAVLGITHFAQDALGDVVYIELPKAGAEVRAGQEIGEVESTKTTSAVYTPVSGKILAVNEDLKDKPEWVNQDPYGKGWIVKIEMTDPSEVNPLMDAKQYGAYLKEKAD